ncbi:MAG: hypothetical protein GX846_10580, partial [Deltaproteobacteria bacterium]|nr:hypothetical protein [Deltaproteobacteria bacterium]
MQSPQTTKKKLKEYNRPVPVRLNGKKETEKEALVTRYAPLVKTIAGRLALRLPQHIGQDDLT